MHEGDIYLNLFMGMVLSWLQLIGVTLVF